MVRGKPPSDSVEQIIRRYVEGNKETEIRTSAAEVNDIIEKYGEENFNKHLLEKYPKGSFRRTERYTSRSAPVKNPAAKSKTKERSRSDGNVPEYAKRTKNPGKKPMGSEELQASLLRNVREDKSSGKKEPLMSKSKFTIPRGQAGGARPDGTFYPDTRKVRINNNPDDHGLFKSINVRNAHRTKIDPETYYKFHGMQNKASQTGISAMGGEDEAELGTRSLIRCIDVRDPKKNFGLDIPRQERGRRYYERVIHPSIPTTKDGWADFSKINRKWTANQDRFQREEFVDDATADTLSKCLFDSYERSFDDLEKEEFIIPNVITEDYKAYEDIEEEETNEVIIINSTVEDDDPEDKTLVPDDAKEENIVFWPKDIEDDNFVFLAPSSQDVRFLKERE